MIGEKWRYYFKVVWSLLFIFFLTSCSPEAVEPESSHEPIQEFSSFELEILDLVNNYRASSGYTKLQRSKEISMQARHHSDHMFRTREVCHHNFGRRYQVLTEQIGAKAMAENVAYGYRTSEACFNAWLKSPNHRKIIEGKNTHFGISAKQADGKNYVTLIFIRK